MGYDEMGMEWDGIGYDMMAGREWSWEKGEGKQGWWAAEYENLVNEL